MARRLRRRLRRNAGSVVSILVRDVLLRGKNLVGLAAGVVGLAALVQSLGALGGGALVSTAVFGLIGGTALYGATASVLGHPLRGASVFLAGLLLVGGGAHALGVGPADTTDDSVTVDKSGVDWDDDQGRVPPDDDAAADDDPIGAHGGCGSYR